jgi:pimeloyl-ACP methyl ester carboxylesterase
VWSSVIVEVQPPGDGTAVLGVGAIRPHVGPLIQQGLVEPLHLAVGLGATASGPLRELGLPQIPPEQLARITVPTTLIWGRHDRVMPLRTAQEASARHGWPLRVIDHAGHFSVADQPAAFLAPLRVAIDNR